MLPYNALSGKDAARNRTPTNGPSMTETHDHPGFTAHERRVLYITCPCHFFCHFFILVFPAVTMPLVSDLGMPLEDVVKLSFLMYLCFGLFALPVGQLVDRWQARGMLIIGLYLMGIGLLIPGLYPHPKLMYVSLGVVGMGASVYHPAGLALISRSVRQRGYALGINGVFGNLGIASAPLVTGVLTWLFGWQTTFVILGATGIAAGIATSFIPVDETIARTSREHGADGGQLRLYFLILCFALVFAGISYRGNMLLLPAYLELNTTFFNSLLERLSFLRTQGTATLAATVLTSFVLVTGIFGQIAGGRLADRMDLRRAYLLYHGASLPFILAMAFAGNYLLALCAAVYAFFSLGMQPIENSLIAALTPHKWRSTSYAVKFILNFGVGASVVYIIGPIKNAFSLETVYVFLAGATGLLVLSIVALTVASRRVPSIRN
jgi:MFS family permease